MGVKNNATITNNNPENRPINLGPMKFIKNELANIENPKMLFSIVDNIPNILP